MSEELFWDGSGVKASEVLEETKRLSVEFPDRVGRTDDDGCVYTAYEIEDDEEYGRFQTSRPTKPVCIVGTAVYNLTGKFVPQVFEGNRITTDEWRLALGVYGDDGGPAEQEAWSKLVNVQIQQDKRHPWGNCFPEEETH